MANAAAVHADGTTCDHDGAPFMAGTQGPAMCPGGIRVTHIRVPGGRLVPLGEAVAAVQSVANTLASTLTPLVIAATGYARSAGDRPALAAVAAAAGVLDMISQVERPASGSDGEQPGQRFDPCGNGAVTSGELPGQAPLPFTVSLDLPRPQTAARRRAAR